MKVRIDLNESTSQYEVTVGKTLIASSAAFGEALENAEGLAKAHRGEVLVAHAILADWYCGFPHKEEESPVLFTADEQEVLATVGEENCPYRFVEGPFLSADAAGQAAFAISGKPGVKK